jgi:hypothetical protein
MATWLGICILVLFSLGLNWFMRGQGKMATPSLPPELGEWRKCARAEHEPEGSYWECRTLLRPGSLFVRAYLFEQRRLRRASDGEILEVQSERRIKRGFPI